MIRRGGKEKMTKYCDSCVLSDKIKNICMRSGATIDQNADYCSKHTAETVKCDVCGRPTLIEHTIIHTAEDDYYLMCGECHMMTKSCAICQKYNVCEFETNTENTMPKTVMKTVRQGTMVIQSEVINEERVKALCHNCECWDAECGCMKMHNIQCFKINTDDFFNTLKSVKNSHES